MRKIAISKDDGILYFVAIVVSVSNIVFYQNAIISYAMAFLQSIWLLYLAIKRQYVKYLCYYVIFLSTCLEFSVFVNGGDFYSLKEIRFFGVNMGIWLFIPIALAYFIDIRNTNRNYYRYKVFRKNTDYFIVINIIAMITGIICILVNDNNIRNMAGYLSTYIDNAYTFMFLPLMIIITYRLALKYNESEISKMYNGLQAVLWGGAFQVLVSAAFKIRGTYGGVAILNLSLGPSVFLPFLFLLSFYEESKYKTANMILAVVSSFLMLQYASAGKTFITYGIAVLIFFMKMISEKNAWKQLGGIVLILMLLFCIPPCLSYFASQNKGVFNYKLYQAKQLFSIHKWSMEYIRNMEDSPRVRLGEFFNVIIEYLKKPWFVFTGKGYGSSVLDYSGILGLIPLNGRADAYPAAQFENGTFVNLHEITSVMLVFGLPGFVFLCKIAKYVLKAFKTNFWIIIGAFWFLVYYGYSYTIGTFGVTALCFGILQYSQTVDRKNEFD